ncbi:MAG: hypothetical protein LWW85_11315 [Marinilabiliales bacterium]|nr:hypothetical protein [Marinilabiliales bacterium]
MSGFASFFPKRTLLKRTVVSARVLFACLILLGSLQSTAKDPDFNYLKNGVFFSLPADWRIISDEDLPEKGHYFAAENGKQKRTGFFSYVILNTLENPSRALLIQQQNMRSEELYQTSGIEFTVPEKSRFGGSETLAMHYESIVKGIKIQGTIHCFNCTEKTFLIFLQSGLADQKENTKVFKLIESTFGCR